MNKVVVIAALFFASVASAAEIPTTSEHTPFIFSRRGDDGLSLLFSDRLLAALSSSSGLALSEQNPGTLEIYVARNVTPRRVNDRLQIEYDVEFNMYGRTVARSSGACFEDELDACVASVMSELKVVIQKLHNRP